MPSLLPSGSVTIASPAAGQVERFMGELDFMTPEMLNCLLEIVDFQRQVGTDIKLEPKAAGISSDI